MHDILKYKLCRVVDPSKKVPLWGTRSVIRGNGSQTEVPDLKSGGTTQFNHCSSSSSMFTETEETGMRGTWRERVETRDSDDFFGVGIDNDEVEAASGAVQITRHHAAPKYTAIASWHCPPHSGRNTIYVTTRCPSVTRLFVCLSRLAPCGGGFVGVGMTAGGWCRSTATGAPQQQRRRSTALSSKCEQCQVYSQRRRLKAYLLITDSYTLYAFSFCVVYGLR